MFLRLKNLVFSFGHNKEKKILNDVSFEVQKGETLVIVGGSGSGKTTLLKLIAGILPESGDTFSGEITIDGKSSSEYLRNGRLGFMFQKPALLPNLTTRENIELPLKIENTKSDSDSVIEIVGLKNYQNYLPKRLSGGMKTRVSLARSFITKPELLLLDEPFSSLDVAWKDTLYQELRELKNKFNTTVILVTHDIEEAIKLGDKIICLGAKGNIILKKDDVKEANLYQEIERAIITDHKLSK